MSNLKQHNRNMLNRECIHGCFVVLLVFMLIFAGGITFADFVDPKISSITSNRTRASDIQLGTSQWDADVLWSGVNKISGVTIGDLDPTRDGNEVVAVDGVGKVVLTYRTGSGTWDSIELWQGQGELITPVIGDFYSGHDGNELVVVGMAVGPEGEGAGQATMIYGSGDNWRASVIFTNEDSMLHGAAVGDLDPTRDGKELILMSFGFEVMMLTWNGISETDWTSTLMWQAEGKVRKGIIDNIDPTHKGNELVVVDKSGNCTMIYGSGTTWNTTTLWTDPGNPGLARVAVGDADPTYSGKELVVGGDSNNVGIIWRTGTTWEGKVIFTDTDKIRGTGIGDVDPTTSGNEILVFSYSKKVTLLTKSGSSWKSRTIFVDTGRSHDLAVGEFNPDHPGAEIVIGGYSNNVTMIGVSPWYYDVMWSGANKLSGVTIGDLDPTRDGNEVIAVDGVGKVIMIHRSKSGTWDSVELWQGQGELITPVIGDFYSGHKGNELVVVGMAVGPEGEGAGQATIIYGSGDNWEHEVIYTNTDSMLHGAAVGDLDPTRYGKELIVMSFGFDVKMLTWNGPEVGGWTSTLMWHAEGKVRKGIIDDFDPLHKGNELVVVDKSGNCTMLTGSGTTWNATTLWTDPGNPGLARVGVGDVDPTYSGKEIVVGGDSNNVGIIRRTGDTWDGKVIFTDTDKIRGIGIGDIDPTNPGNEISVFGYSNKVTLLTGSGDNWNSRTIFTDDGRSHDLALGEFDPLHIGQELVIGGYSNNVTMIMNNQLTEEPDFSMYAYPTTQSIYSNDKVEFTIGVIALSGFNEPVEFSVEDLPQWISSNIYPSSIIPDSTATLTISVLVTKNKEDIYFTINASSGKLYHLFDLRLNLIGDTEPPEIESTFPIDKDEDINPQAPIVIWFDEPIDPNSITEDSISIIEDESGSVFIGDHEYIEESNMLMVTDIHAQNDAAKGLPNSKLIKITLKTSISDLAGNTLSKNYQFEYLTSEEDISPFGSPAIKSVYPEQDAVGVPIDSPIIIEFNIPIDDKTLTWDNMEITSDKGDKYTGSINYDPNNLILTINDIQLIDGSEIKFKTDSKLTVTLKTGIKSITGEPLPSAFSWDFETGEPTASEDNDELKEERDMYLGGLIITVIIIILLLLVLANSRKREPSTETKSEPDQGRVKRPTKPVASKKTKARSGKRGK